MGGVGRLKFKITVALIVRLGLIFFIIPVYLSDFYAPFIQQLRFDLDIWSLWLNQGGDDRAFPYGLPMILIYTPSLILSKIIQIFTTNDLRALEISIGIQVLAIECLLWRYIEKTRSMRGSLEIFLFSPLIIWVNYFLGLNDLFPSTCLFLGAYFLLNHKYLSAGVLIGISIGMKFSLGLVLPFLILFAWDNPRFKKNVWKTAGMSLSVGIASYAPAIYSRDFRQIVFGNEETFKAFGYYLNLGNQKFLLLPFVYVLLLYWLWRAGRISLQVLIAFFGVALFAISAFSPASIGWMLWGLPLMFMNLAKEIKTRTQLLLIQVIFVMYSVSEGIQLKSNSGYLKIPMWNSLYAHLLLTLGITLVIIFSYSSLKAAIRNGDIYRIAEAPLTFSIAGDSGTGKDTLGQALMRMFTTNTATMICGDDYHKFERGDASWKNITHLNPAANYLDLWERDVRLAYSRRFYEQREYDHISGKFSPFKPRLSRDVLISQGLHGLYPSVSAKSDLRIFLSMDDDLRIKLKLNRDQNLRAQTFDSVLESIKKRENDYTDFVEPQKMIADIQFHLFEEKNQLNLRVSSLSNSVIDEFVKNLTLYSESSITESTDFTRKIYEIFPGKVKQNGFNQILKTQLVDFDQLFLDEPEIPDGALGIMATMSIIVAANRREL
jgi:uridine kinase